MSAVGEGEGRGLQYWQGDSDGRGLPLEGRRIVDALFFANTRSLPMLPPAAAVLRLLKSFGALINAGR